MPITFRVAQRSLAVGFKDFIQRDLFGADRPGDFFQTVQPWEQADERRIFTTVAQQAMKQAIVLPDPVA